MVDYETSWRVYMEMVNKLGLLSNLEFGIKTPLSLRERAILPLTGPVTGDATDSEGQALKSPG